MKLRKKIGKKYYRKKFNFLKIKNWFTNNNDFHNEEEKVQIQCWLYCGWIVIRSVRKCGPFRQMSSSGRPKLFRVFQKVFINQFIFKLSLIQLIYIFIQTVVQMYKPLINYNFFPIIKVVFILIKLFDI